MFQALNNVSHDLDSLETDVQSFLSSIRVLSPPRPAPPPPPPPETRDFSAQKKWLKDEATQHERAASSFVTQDRGFSPPRQPSLPEKPYHRASPSVRAESPNPKRPAEESYHGHGSARQMNVSSSSARPTGGRFAKSYSYADMPAPS